MVIPTSTATAATFKPVFGAVDALIGYADTNKSPADELRTLDPDNVIVSTTDPASIFAKVSTFTNWATLQEKLSDDKTAVFPSVTSLGSFFTAKVLGAHVNRFGNGDSPSLLERTAAKLEVNVLGHKSRASSEALRWADLSHLSAGALTKRHLTALRIFARHGNMYAIRLLMEAIAKDKHTAAGNKFERLALMALPARNDIMSQEARDQLRCYYGCMGAGVGVEEDVYHDLLEKAQMGSSVAMLALGKIASLARKDDQRFQTVMRSVGYKPFIKSLANGDCLAASVLSYFIEAGLLDDEEFKAALRAVDISKLSAAAMRGDKMAVNALSLILSRTSRVDAYEAIQTLFEKCGLSGREFGFHQIMQQIIAENRGGMAERAKAFVGAKAAEGHALALIVQDMLAGAENGHDVYAKAAEKFSALKTKGLIEDLCELVGLAKEYPSAKTMLKNADLSSLAARANEFAGAANYPPNFLDALFFAASIGNAHAKVLLGAISLDNLYQARDKGRVMNAVLSLLRLRDLNNEYSGLIGKFDQIDGLLRYIDMTAFFEAYSNSGPSYSQFEEYAIEQIFLMGNEEIVPAMKALLNGRRRKASNVEMNMLQQLAQGNRVADLVGLLGSSESENGFVSDNFLYGKFGGLAELRYYHGDVMRLTTAEIDEDDAYLKLQDFKHSAGLGRLIKVALSDGKYSQAARVFLTRALNDGSLKDHEYYLSTIRVSVFANGFKNVGDMSFAVALFGLGVGGLEEAFRNVDANSHFESLEAGDPEAITVISALNIFTVLSEAKGLVPRLNLNPDVLALARGIFTRSEISRRILTINTGKLVDRALETDDQKALEAVLILASLGNHFAMGDLERLKGKYGEKIERYMNMLVSTGRNRAGVPVSSHVMDSAKIYLGLS